MQATAPYRHDAHTLGAQRGFGLLEVLVVMAVVVAATAVLWPNLRDALDMRRLKAASSHWSALIQSARHWAFTLNRPVRLEFQGGAAPCLVLHTGARGACSGCGTSPCSSGAQRLGTTPPLPYALTASASSASLVWSPTDRTVTPTGTLRLELPDGRALHHVVNLVGRMRVCSPAGTVKGVATC
jgi:type IV fimbrial biogenesis protein FimT